MNTETTTQQTTIQALKSAIIEHNKWMVKANTYQNSTYEQIADKVWAEQVLPFVHNEEITTWEADIQKKFVDNPYVRIIISEKQAYCMARAYARLNPGTIK